MAEKHNATCAICGRSYYMCSSCKDAIKTSPWKLHTDTPEHYKVFQVVHGLSTGVYTKKEAVLKLQNIDLSDLDSFKENIKNIIKDIMKQKVEDVIEPSVENDVIENVIDEVLAVEKYDETKINRKKKSSKIIVEADEYAVPIE